MLSLKPENVVEGTFYGFPPCAAFVTLVIIHPIANNRISPPEVVELGTEIICSPENRRNPHIHSKLRELLEEAATGSRQGDLHTFSTCFEKLL